MVPVLRHGYRLARHFALIRVHASQQMPVRADGLFEPMIRDIEREGQGSVRESESWVQRGRPLGPASAGWREHVSRQSDVRASSRVAKPEPFKGSGASLIAH